MKNKLLVIGPVTKDIIKTSTDTYSQIGGASYYQMWTLHQLKQPATSIITIGKNDVEMINDFPNKNHVKTIETQQTTQYENIYSEDNTRTQKAILPNNPITTKDIEKTNINLSEYNTALLSPLSTTDIPPNTIQYLKNKNLKTVLVAQGYLRSTDENQNVINQYWENKELYLNNTDILSLDDEEIKTAFNIKKITDKKIIDITHKYDLENIIITKGENGSSIYTKTEKIEIPAIKTNKAVDYTGLGDTYIATYITELNKDKPIYEAGLKAAITSKYKLEHKGHLKTTDKTIEKELKRRLN